jgi:hypothetical protein
VQFSFKLTINNYSSRSVAPTKQSIESFLESNSEKNNLAPYRRPISASSATPPKKGILKPPPPPNSRSLWKRDWLSTINTRLQNVASVTVAPNTTSFFTSALKRLNSSTAFSYTAQQEEQQQQQQPKLQQDQEQPHQVLHINTTTPADQISQSNSQDPLLSPNNSLLTSKTLKRVRFSVAKLTDEYPHSPIPGDSDNSDWEDEYDFREWNEKQKRKDQPEIEQKKNCYTPREMMQFYLSACKNREEFHVYRLVKILRVCKYFI